ncbi:MAG: hydroxyacylglutathione hydrolase, partial [Gammaproteobacteria bacterium]|nr:hydroxyacylglutathione hydrolase [Gammaproteobacteria bacterium]
GASFTVIEVPGHTLDHVAFFSDSALFDSPIAFTGDTLFVAGCGRLFEGTAENMHESLQKLNDLPENTSIYCAHEYTLANLKYAAFAEPDNSNIRSRLAAVENLRAQEISTVPTTLAMERLTNPFLRAKDSSELAVRRLQKDNF